MTQPNDRERRTVSGHTRPPKTRPSAAASIEHSPVQEEGGDVDENVTFSILAGCEVATDQHVKLAENALTVLHSGKFRSFKRLAQGGSGIAWTARDLSLRRELAIKTLRNPEPTARVRFIDEAQITAQLESLTAPDWTTAHVHPKFGSRAAGEILGAWLAHDFLHMRQLVRLQFDRATALTKPYPTEYAGEW